MGRCSVFYYESTSSNLFFENTKIKESCLINLGVLVGAPCHLVIFKLYNLFLSKQQNFIFCLLVSKKGGSGLITKNHRDTFYKGHIESSLIEAETVT